MSSASPNLTDLAQQTSQPRRASRQDGNKQKTSRGRIAGIVAGSTALALAVGGVVTYNVIHKTVSIEVNGKPVEVSTYSSSVSEVLAENRVRYTERDLIVPSLRSEVSDGATIVVQSARKIGVEVDGVPTSIWSTALNADEAVEALAGRGDNTALTVSRSAANGRESLGLGLGEATTVTLTVDGDSKSKSLKVDSVDEALSDFGVELGDRDKIQMDKGKDGLAITVARVTTADRADVVEIPFTAVEQEDPSLLEGKTKVIQEGQPGIATTNYVTVLEDGVEIRRAVVSKGVTQEPVAQITAVGTKEKVEAPPKTTPPKTTKPKDQETAEDTATPPQNTGSGADSLNWAALAKCESGGNPSIVSKNGKYHGLYQFSVSTWSSVGGSGLPSQASPDEQTLRAKMLYNRSGAGQWPHCGKNLFK